MHMPKLLLSRFTGEIQAFIFNYLCRISPLQLSEGPCDIEARVYANNDYT